MSKVLIVQGHPDPAQTHLCHAIASHYCMGAESSGHEVRLITVATEDVPFLRTKEEWESGDLPRVAQTGQAAVTWADHIVLIYPLWMGDLPALLKAWIEQVFRENFAFEKQGLRQRGALRGKSARVIVTMGMPGFVYYWFFFAHSLRSLVRNTLKIAGLGPVRWSIIGNVEDPSGRVQKHCLATAEALGRRAK